jgi:hypothetical protein
LTHQEIDILASQVGSIRCSGCGAAVDITKDSVCSYCHAPIVVLDPNAVQKALAVLQESANAQLKPDQSAVADALLLSQRQKDRQEWNDKLQKASLGLPGWRNLEDGPIAKGVDLLWHLFQK